jgi:hypothetical protein
MGRVPWRTLVPLALLLLPAPATAAARFSEVTGHLSIGYGKLVATAAPAGSLSLAAGMDYPLARTVRAGFEIGYDMLGSRTVQRGSLFATVDYSAFELAALAHWLPERGPVRRVSLGPALVSARGELSVTGGGAGFSDLAVHRTAGAVAAQVTLMSARPAPVKPGLELGVRRAFLGGDDAWTLLSARVTVHY